MVGVGQDATQQRPNELTQLIETANAPIFGIDANGLVNEWNRKTATITGFRRAPRHLPPHALHRLAR